MHSCTCSGISCHVSIAMPSTTGKPDNRCDTQIAHFNIVKKNKKKKLEFFVYLALVPKYNEMPIAANAPRMATYEMVILGAATSMSPS